MEDSRPLSPVEQSVLSFIVFILNLLLLALHLRSKASSQWLTGSPFSIESWGIFICFCSLGAVLLSGSGCRWRVMLMRTVLADMFYFIAGFWPLRTFLPCIHFAFAFFGNNSLFPNEKVCFPLICQDIHLEVNSLVHGSTFSEAMIISLPPMF